MSGETRLDDCLSIRNGHLFVEDLDAVELVQRFGSPLFVFSEDQIRRNVRRFQAAFQQGWPDGPVQVLPAAKANWLLAVQRILADEGCGADIYSAGELIAALQAGIDPQRISVNGVPKDKAHIHRSLEAGARITVDSVQDVDLITQVVQQTGLKAVVRLRLKPVVSGFVERSDFVAEGLVPTDIAALAYKGGLIFDEVMAVAPRLMAMENVEIAGFHQHHGRHHRSTRYWQAQMQAYAAEIGRVCQALDGYRPKEIDIGGGFAIPRDPFNAATHYTEPIQLAAMYGLSRALRLAGDEARYRVMRRLIDTIVSTPNQEMAPSIEQYAAACTHTLRRELPQHGIDPAGVVLQLEPGRALHGNAGIHLSTVKAIKRITNPIHWNIVVVDTTEFWFTGGRYEHHLHDYWVANKADAPMAGTADVIGRSCYGDRLLPTVRVPEVEVGDIFAFLDTGAYQEVSCSNFNAMPRPAAVLVTGDQAAIIRRAETEDEVFRRDVVPSHLQRALDGQPSLPAQATSVVFCI